MGCRAGLGRRAEMAPFLRCSVHDCWLLLSLKVPSGAGHRSCGDCLRVLCRALQEPRVSLTSLCLGPRSWDRYPTLQIEKALRELSALPKARQLGQKPPTGGPHHCPMGPPETTRT